MRLLWYARGKRAVRVYLEVREGDTSSDATIEGVLVGRWAGHYVLELAHLLENPTSSHALRGHVEIPAERVLFIQVIGKGAR
jgi:hypothetical protein